MIEIPQNPPLKFQQIQVEQFATTLSKSVTCVGELARKDFKAGFVHGGHGWRALLGPLGPRVQRVLIADRE